jgi:hypothetical protein
MKKKSPRGIPDFSSKGPRSVPLPKSEKEKPVLPAAIAPRIKPPATSAKSGRRGS